MLMKIAELTPRYSGRLFVYDFDGDEEFTPLLEYVGSKTKARIWYGCEISRNGSKRGEVFIHYDNRLIPVYEQMWNGIMVRHRMSDLEDVCASYWELEDSSGAITGMITDFYRE